jgi:hypothetical protein
VNGRRPSIDGAKNSHSWWRSPDSASSTAPRLCSLAARGRKRSRRRAGHQRGYRDRHMAAPPAARCTNRVRSIAFADS